MCEFREGGWEAVQGGARRMRTKTGESANSARSNIGTHAHSNDRRCSFIFRCRFGIYSFVRCRRVPEAAAPEAHLPSRNGGPISRHHEPPRRASLPKFGERGRSERRPTVSAHTFTRNASSVRVSGGYTRRSQQSIKDRSPPARTRPLRPRRRRWLCRRA